MGRNGPSGPVPRDLYASVIYMFVFSYVIFSGKIPDDLDHVGDVVPVAQVFVVPAVINIEVRESEVHIK